MSVVELFYEHIGKSILFLIILLVILKARLDLQKERSKENEYKKVFIENVEKRFASESTAQDATQNERKKQWYYSMVAEAAALEATISAQILRLKKRPAVSKAKEIEGPIKEKIVKLTKENARLRLELKIFDEHFPEYAEIREHILDSEEALFETSEDGDKTDRVRKFLTAAEYERLDETSRNQLALDKYISRNHSQQEIGRLYERYLGYLWESRGWEVQFIGLVDGFEDLGRDLICKKENAVEIIQAKNWASHKTIHEKHLYQLYATKTHYCLSKNLNREQEQNVKAVFATTTDLSDMAKEVAEYLKISVQQIPLKKDYPMIKCNINPTNKTKIYHLPFDQQYDKIKVGDQQGECYLQTVAEAEKKGFRRAFRWRSRGQA